MRKYLFILFLPLLLAFGCNNNAVTKQHTSEQDSVRYYNLIMNLIIDNYKYLVPDYGQEGMLLRSDTTYYLYKATHVLRKYYKPDTMNGFTGTRELYNPELGLEFRMHRWTCGCEVSLPNTIIYLSNKKDFDYAFILHDESIARSYDTARKAIFPDGPPPLWFQLNYLTNRLKVNYVADKKQCEQLITIITDSLLGLQKIGIADTTTLVGEFMRDMEKTDPCAVYINKATDRMINELKERKPDVHYFHSSSKYYKGFWRFELMTYQDNRLFIKADFTRCDCGESKPE